jgi:hypothetical protein
MVGPAPLPLPDTVLAASLKISSKLFHEAWGAQASEEGRFKLFYEFLGRSIVDAEEIPIMGVGVSATETGSEQLEILTPLQESAIDVSRLLQKLGLSHIPFHVTAEAQPIPAGRPASGGHSIGDWKGSEGTMGCLVRDASGEKFILSCNHVIAGLNNGRCGVDTTLEPGRTGSRIGTLYAFENIVFGGSRPNKIDAAISRPDKSSDVATGVGSLVLSGALTSVPLNAAVTKHGAASGKTKGTIMARGLALIMPYGSQKALFEEQFMVTSLGIKRFAKPGDSGAVVLDDANAVVGLLFGIDGALDLTYVNPIDPVLQHFNVQIC